MSDTILKRAASAICEARCSPERPDPGKGLDEFIARAMLQAIREPSDAMIYAGEDEADKSSKGVQIMPLWQAMIDAALTDA